jgi:hypothetical protein
LIDEFEEILVARELEILQNVEQSVQTLVDKVLQIISAQNDELASLKRTSSSPTAQIGPKGKEPKS